ncbi:MAG: DUF58 domain-containing protein [Halobacteriales archaeon]
MNRGRFALLIGVVTLAVGAVALVAPGIIPLRPDRAIVTVIGVLALVQAIRVIQRRRHGALDEARTHDPERRVVAPRPGRNIDDVLAWFLEGYRTYPPGRRMREGLTAVTTEVLTHFEGLTDSDAAEQVDAGTWTEDGYAASFLGGADAPDPPLRTRIRDGLRGETATRRRARHAVDAIVATVERHVPRGVTTDAPGDRDAEEATPEEGSDRPPSTPDADDPGRGAEKSRSTGHWRGVSVIAFVGLGVGILAERPAVLLAAVVGVGYAAYARSPVLGPGTVAIERTLDTDTPANGETVTVTVTVTNTGDRTLPDLRVVDGVPETLSVDDGSPRLGTALRPGRSSEFSYTVTARRGVHEFGPTRVIGRDLTGGTEVERLYTSDTTLTCIPALSAGTEPIPLRRSGNRFVGRERAPTTGEGVEFSATREYRPGDPMGRIDWNRRARTRELTTIEFREERAATVVVVIDVREPAYVSPGGGESHAVDRAVDAAGQVFAQLERQGNRVGIAASESESCWLAPDSGADHRARARELLAVEPALSPRPEAEHPVFWGWEATLHSRLDPGTQVVYLSPLVDETPVRTAREFEERGFPVTVISPNPTTDGSPGHRLAGVARQLRISTLRRAGVPVIDWSWTEPLDAALARHDDPRGRP